MKITYDPKYDLLYLKMGEAKKVLCKEVNDDITVDMDAKGKLIGIEILSASQHVDLKMLLPVEIKKTAVR
ncbi:MAG: DUF2283 domain-containing protein [Deltaproteobacteria bacterium]|nr:DUF2283 domain-containing protein [Deltaproteobacteria bacterium]MCL5792198.1 DUF2283 domain-containing protein [Deltaproteobacteria bacterium]